MTHKEKLLEINRLHEFANRLALKPEHGGSADPEALIKLNRVQNKIALLESRV